MTLLSVTGQSQASPEDGWRTPAWTLTASGALSVVICAMVSPYRLSWVEALFYGALWVGLQFGIAMVAGRLASRYATPGRPNAPLNVRLALVAMWFAPVAALFVRHSPALVFAAVCMAFALASVERAGREEPHGRFFEAVALQSGVVALARGHVGVAALCLAVVAYRIARIEALQSRVWRSRVPVTVAVTLTVIGLLPISQRELAGASMDGPTPPKGSRGKRL